MKISCKDNNTKMKNTHKLFEKNAYKEKLPCKTVKLWTQNQKISEIKYSKLLKVVH